MPITDRLLAALAVKGFFGSIVFTASIIVRFGPYSYVGNIYFTVICLMPTSMPSALEDVHVWLCCCWCCCPGFQGVLDNTQRKKYLMQFFNMVADNLLPLHAEETPTALDKDEDKQGKFSSRRT